jgi:23S rRNA (cytosine1962-C5)-methyltransferase
MPGYTQVILKKGKDEAVRRFHPWVFSGAIGEIKGKYQEGDIVEVFSSSLQYLATGYLLSGTIAIKLFSFQQEIINDAFWKAKLKAAFLIRKQLGLVDNPQTNAYRLVHNEGDSFPGLIIDIYGSLAVIQAHSVGMYLLRDSIVKGLSSLFGSKLTAIYDKSSESLRKMTDFKVDDGFLLGEGEDFEVLENGNRFMVNPAAGQKTGFFLDQRENRALISRYASKANVLNMFGYTGGFSVYAAAAGAKTVHTIDSSRPAIEMADKNIALNGIKKGVHKGIVADAKEYLQEMEDGSYDLIILDPPAYAKNLDSRKKALSGYRTINALVFKKIAPGGIIFTFSCSQVVDRQMFFSAVTAAAIDAGRKVRVIHQLSQPADHPINIFHQEGEYLKGLVLYVE